jgi:branched-chain amino acid transport system substrate-binding protein
MKGDSLKHRGRSDASRPTARLVLLVAGTTAIALLATACGSSSSSDAAGTSTSSGSSNGSTTGSPIVLGVAGSFSGVNQASTSLAKNGIEAWRDQVNASGGINGHPVKLVIADSANDPAKALANVHKLVEQDHVIAVIDASDNNESGWASVVDKAGIPVIGASQTPIFGTDPNFYPTGTTLTETIYAQLSLAHSANAGKLALYYCAELSACKGAVGGFSALGSGVGVKVAYSGAVSSTATSYTAACLGGKNAGATSGEVLASSDVFLNVISSCAQQGFKPIWIAGAGVMSGSWLKNDATDGALTGVPAVPWFVDSTPATKAMHAALDKYASGTTSNVNFGESSIQGYVSGVVFETVAKSANIGPDSTPAQLIAALHTVSNQTFGGLTPPLTFPAGKPATVPCSFSAGIKNGAFVLPNGLNLICMPAS